MKAPVKCLSTIALLTTRLFCSGQSSPSVKSQVAEHTRKYQLYLSEKRPDLAIPELQAVVQIDPDNVDAQGNLGVLLYFRGDYNEAKVALRKALTLQPELPKIQALLGMSEEQTGDSSEAVRDLEAAFQKLSDPHVEMETGLALVHLYRQGGQLETAAGVIARLEQIEPANSEVLYIAYRLYSDLAGQAMLSLSLAAPDSAQMHAVMAHEEARQGQQTAAIDQYRQALAIDPKLPGAQFELAQLLRNASDVTQQQEAVSILESALKANPADEQAAVELGGIFFNKGDAKSAEPVYERAVKLAPTDPNALFGMAKALTALNRPKEALPLLEKVISLDPTNASAHFRLATFYRQQGRTEDARKQLEDYQKLRQLKDKMSALYKQMRVEPVRSPDKDSAGEP